MKNGRPIPGTRETGLRDDHPVVSYVRDEVLPLIVETWAPTCVLVFDPPDRPASLEGAPVGLLVVSAAFRGVGLRERVAQVRAGLGSACPVRPLCLTPEEFSVSAGVPGPVLGAARTGITLI